MSPASQRTRQPIDPTRCKIMIEAQGWGPSYQCSRKRGHGTGGKFCWQHSDKKRPKKTLTQKKCTPADERLTSTRGVLSTLLANNVVALAESKQAGNQDRVDEDIPTTIGKLATKLDIPASKLQEFDDGDRVVKKGGAVGIDEDLRLLSIRRSHLHALGREFDLDSIGVLFGLDHAAISQSQAAYPILSPQAKRAGLSDRQARQKIDVGYVTFMRYDMNGQTRTEGEMTIIDLQHIENILQVFPDVNINALLGYFSDEQKNENS